MKSHEQKMHEKEAHQAELERNDLSAWAQKTWARLKSGDLVGRKFALYAVAIGAIIGLAIYLTSGGSTKHNAAWTTLEAASTVDALDDFAKTNPDTVPAKTARLQKARQLLGPRGLTLMGNSLDPTVRTRAIKSVEEAREIFTKLIDDFKGDTTLQCMAIDGAAQAELALVGIPKDGTSDASRDYRGSVEKAIELYRLYEKTAGETAGANAKQAADDLEAKKADVVKLGEFISERLNPGRPQPKMPDLPGGLTPAPAPK
jgi:hypothetical protein